VKSIAFAFVVLSMMLLVPARQLGCVAPGGRTPGVPKSFTLEVVATTMTQIVLQWAAAPTNTSSLQLQRATAPSFAENLKSYAIDKGVRLFADTDREPVSRQRFRGDVRGPLLDPNTTYYYRVKANLGDGGALYSNTVSARVSGPVRGKEGDLWADVVLGKPTFGENVSYQPTKYGISYPGGVLIDKTVKPNRMYIADCNNNRVLGLRSTSPKDGAAIVFGQPNFNSSGGNGDSCAQLFPYRGKASATSLCLTLPTQISIGETVVRSNMAVDEKGNLYVPDIRNNRVLKYNDPFGTDCIADEVWGQADFTGNEPNRGKPTPAGNTLRLDTDRAGVTFDLQGNLWVADSGNNRVLRFLKSAQTGIIAKDADLVLGQPDFSSRGDYGYKRTLAQMWYPIDVEFDSQGQLYVCDGISNNFAGRILVFEPPSAAECPRLGRCPCRPRISVLIRSAGRRLPSAAWPGTCSPTACGSRKAPSPLNSSTSGTATASLPSTATKARALTWTRTATSTLSTSGQASTATRRRAGPSPGLKEGSSSNPCWSSTTRPRRAAPQESWA